MTYISLYRKYRSQTFDDVMGQDHVTRTLQNAIKSGKIGHAYLFCGSRGTGKTTVARLLAKAVNCVHGPTPTPCNECEACTSITNGSAVDVIEMDAASNRSVDDVDALREGVKYPPMRLRYKVYVIDEAHQLSATAKDAFLKTLEEPPAHAIFVLATTEAHDIPLTIRSRCQQFDFRRGSVADIAGRLRYVLENENREADDDAVNVLARSAQGSWRDALSLLEQVVSYTDDRITAEHVNTVLGTVDEDVLFEVSEVVSREDAAAAFELAGRLVHEGKDIRELMKAIAGHFRDLLLASVGAGQETSLRAAERARQFTKERLLSLVEIFSAAEKELRFNEQHRLGLEMAFLKSIAAPAPPAVPVRVSAPAAQSVPARHPAPAAKPGPTPPAAPTAARPPAEPTPASEPALAVEAIGGDLTLPQVRSAWPRLLQYVKDQRKISTHALLKAATVMSVEGSVIGLGFDPKNTFHIESIQRPDNMAVVTAALEAVFGRPLTIRAASIADATTTPRIPFEAPADVDGPPPPGDEGDMVKDVLDMFGGNVDSIDDENYDPWKES